MLISSPGKTKLFGHLAALFTVLVWGVTMVSSKILLEILEPRQLLFARMVLGYVLLWILSPHKLHLKEKKDELLFLGAGGFGVFLYYFLENTALTYSYASNVGVIVSMAPIFTVLVCTIAFKEEKLKGQYFIGSAIALLGIALISFNGAKNLKLNPLGDVLALLAASSWGFYSLFTKKITEKEYPVIPATRRMFFYGMLMMLVALLVKPKAWPMQELFQWRFLKHLLFLGVVASGVCFITWNYSVFAIGPIISSFYIYLCPVITVVCSAVFLTEKITPLAMIGTLLTLVGLFCSEYKPKKIENT
jgi:drug/metabolite transporter (DMT)-like permease